MDKAIDEQISAVRQAIAAQEGMRATLGDAVVDTTVAALRQQLAELEAQVAQPEQQRKLVTVLFGDVSGFTALSETLDAEEVSDVMNAVWGRIDRVIAGQGGRIVRHIGDGVMALWGAETAREDDAERAIRAALGMQSEVRALAEEAGGNPAIQMRIGLNTGTMLLGAVGTTGEFDAMGDAVNLGSRLEHAAPVGGILISHDTYRHVLGIFDVQPLEPLRVKGKSEPIQVYLVEQARPRAFHIAARGVEGIETRTIGRDAELQQLQAALRDVVERRKAHTVTVVGEAGVGKSRLLYEFRNWLELLPERVLVFTARASQQTSNLPYALARDLFAFHFDIHDGDGAAEARRKIEEGISAYLSAEQAHYIGHLMGFDFSDSPYLGDADADAQQMHDRAFASIVQFFGAVTTEAPACLLLEDMHWADSASLDLVDHLSDACHDYPLLVVALARSELYERRPDWGASRLNHARIDLQPLTSEETGHLVDEILRMAESVPPQLRERIVHSAEGNPFYVEEIVKMLIDDGFIEKGDESWNVRAERLADVRVPSTLTEVLQARLDRLPQQERATLQRASVVGRRFWDSVVEQLSRHDGEPAGQTPTALGALQGRELIFGRDEVAFVGTHEYVFKHNILRDVTYESVLLRLRRVYHAQVAEWLVAHSGDRASEYAGQIAEHFERAGDGPRALVYFRQAGDEAVRRYANAEAVMHYTSALELAEQAGDPAALPGLYQARGQVHETLGEFEQARADFEAMHTAAQASHDRSAEWEALLDLGKLWASRDYGRTGEYFREALELARQMDDPATLARSLNRLGNWHLNVEEALEALRYHEEALAIFERLQEPHGVASTHDLMGMTSAMRGDLVSGQGHYEKAVALFRELNDQKGLVGSLAAQPLSGPTFQTNTVVTTRDLPEVTEIGEEALRVAREIGWRSGEAFALSTLGLCLGSQGEYGRALASVREGLAIAEAIGHRQWMTMLHLSTGVILADLLALPESRQHLEQSLALARELASQHWIRTASGFLACTAILQNDPARAHSALEAAIDPDTPALTLGQRQCWCAQADLALAEGDPALALEVIDRLLEWAANISDERPIPRISRLRAEALLALNRLDEAEAALRAALAVLQEQGARPMLWRVYQSLGRLHQAQGRQPEAEAAFDAAREIVDQLAATIPDDALKDNFREKAAAQFPPD